MSVDISYRRIVLITYPVVITQISHTLLGVVDAIMVGRLGVTALAAVGLGNIFTWLLFCFFWGLFSGVNTLVAQAVGARADRACGVSLWQGVYLGAIASAAMLAVWPFVGHIFALTGTSEAVQHAATSYMRLRLLGAPGFVLLLVADNFYRGLGRTLPAMWAGMLQTLLNCTLNYVFIYGKFGAPALGTDGAAIGTIIAVTLTGSGLAATIFLTPTIRRTYAVLETAVFDAREFARLLRLSLPIGLQVFWEMASITVFMAVIGRLGDAQLAAAQAVIQSWSVAFMPAFALSVGATTLVGQCVGARQPDEARRVARRILHMGYVLMVPLAAVYLLAPGRLMGLFLTGADLARVLPYARPMFLIVALTLWSDAQFNIGSGALRGAGDTTYTMVVNIATAWLVLVPLTLAVAPRFGLTGAWACFIPHLGIMGGATVLRIRGTRWLRSAYAPAAAAAPSPAQEGTITSLGVA